MPAKKKHVPALKKTARQPMNMNPISISPMHSSAEESGEPVEEVQQIHIGETEHVTIPTVVTTRRTTGPTFTTTTTTSTVSTLTATSAFLPKTLSTLRKKDAC